LGSGEPTLAAADRFLRAHLLAAPRAAEGSDGVRRAP
jgi:hypothetical protein